MSAYLRAVGAVVWKDLRLQWRGRGAVVTMILFAAVVVTAFGLSLDPVARDVEEALPGVLWITVLFAAVLGLDRSFSLERRDGVLSGLMGLPVDRSAVFWGKLLSNLIFMLATVAAVLPLFFALFGVKPTGGAGAWTALLVTATWDIAAVGTFLSALTTATRASAILLPITLLPLMVPVLIGAVELTEALMTAGTMAAADIPWMQVLLLFALLFTLLPTLLFDLVLEG